MRTEIAPDGVNLYKALLELHLQYMFGSDEEESSHSEFVVTNSSFVSYVNPVYFPGFAQSNENSENQNEENGA